MVKRIQTALTAKLCEQERGLAFLDVLNIISGKWKMIIICTIKFDKMRFSAIQKLLPDITPRMLSRELKELELNSIITRLPQAKNHTTIEYSLTDSAKEIVDIVMELVSWGVKHRKKYIQDQY